MITKDILQSGEYHLDRNAFILGKEPLIFHCNHYNVFLQMSLENTKEFVDIDMILTDSAQEIAFHQFTNLFSEFSVSVDDRKTTVEEYFKNFGFGLIDLKACDQNGGVVETTQEHYAAGWIIRFGLRKKEDQGVGYFARGFLAGALEAIYDLKLGTLQTNQTKCLAKGDDVSRFEVTVRDEKVELSESPQEGSFQIFSDYPTHSNINYEGIREALIGMDFIGDDKTGFIDAFGVLLTRHYANYYNLISLRTMLSMEKEFGEPGIKIVQELLTEAAHVCSFYTLGGIMLSAEWNAMIKPMIKERDDWTHGIIAVCNAMGWGLWEIEELNPEGISKFKVTSAYETNAFMKFKEDNDNFPSSGFLEGAFAGIMNLIYHGDITKTPTLDSKYYNETFKKKGKFTGKLVKSRTKGDDFELIEVARS